MTNIDKIIRFDFKHVKERYFFMLAVIVTVIICRELFHIGYVLLISFIVLIYQGSKISEYIYREGLFGDGDTMYKSFPIEPEELIVSKLVLGWVITLTTFAAIALMGLLSWGMPEVETKLLDFLYSAMGMFYRFGAVKCIVILALTMLYILEIEIIAMASFAARSRSGDEGSNKEVALWTMVGAKPFVILIVGLIAVDAQLKIMCILFVIDILTNIVFCYFALRYTKAVIEGRR